MSIAKWSFARSRARLAALPAIAIAGGFIWMLLPQASDAESRSAATSSELTRVTQNTSGTDAATQATLTGPVQPEVPGDAGPAAVARTAARRVSGDGGTREVADRRTENRLAVVAAGRARLESAGDVHASKCQ